MEIYCIWFTTRRSSQVLQFRDYMNSLPCRSQLSGRSVPYQHWIDNCVNLRERPLSDHGSLEGHDLGKVGRPGTPLAYLQRLLSRHKLLVLWGTGSTGSLSDCALRQSRNSLNARPKRCDRLLDHESLVRQSRHNSLDNKECGEAKDRKPPGVGYHDVIPVWQSFILGNLEEELARNARTTARQGRRCIVQRGRRFGSQARRRRCGTAVGGQRRIESSRVKSQKGALSVRRYLAAIASKF